MARRGRKRKDGQREPNGRIKRPTLAQIAAAHRSAQDAEKIVALMQPHRRGDADYLLESALGRFVVRRRLDRKCFDAGEKYANLRRQWCAATGAPMPDRLAGSGADIATEVVREWRKKLDSMEDAMMTAYGVAALGWVGSLSFDRLDMPHGHPAEADTAGALITLAIELGMVDRRRLSG